MEKSLDIPRRLRLCRNDEKGFTLVELSIVLVIIGLLIGGILVGQSLIESAKINKEVSRLSQYAIAVVQFKEKFRQEAGDSDFFEPNGDGDGDNDDALLGGSCTAPGGEYSSAWAHLTQSAMLTGETYVWPNAGAECTAWTSNNGAGYIGITPTNKISEYYGWVMPYYYYTRPSGYNLGGNIYQRIFYASYAPEMLWGIENKLDDGVPSQSTGRIASYTSGMLGAACDLIGVEQEAVVMGEYIYCTALIHFNDSLN